MPLARLLTLIQPNRVLCTYLTCAA